MDLIRRILEKLGGVDFWIAILAIAVSLAGWYYIGTEGMLPQETAKDQIIFVTMIALLAVSGIAIHHLFFVPRVRFSKKATGILALRIEGDDAQNTLQHELVSTLNEEIRKEAPQAKIEVRASKQVVTEEMGLQKGHEKVRKIGKKSRAMLVIWGTRVGEKKFHPRLTVVEDQARSTIGGEHTLLAQDITELKLPVELVGQPIFLAHFAAGYAFYNRGAFAGALAHFEAALQRSVATDDELTDLRLFAGTSHLRLAPGQRDMAAHLEKAISYYQAALTVLTEHESPENWANVQHNIGTAYGRLSTDGRSKNLQKAISAFEAALRVLTEKDFPKFWAGTQNNLGTAYRTLSIGDRSENLKKAIAAHEAALRVFTEKECPADWARTQNSLGIAYAGFIGDDHEENLKKAIAAYEAALRVYAEKDYPADWAMIQSNLGIAYKNLSTGNLRQNIKSAIACFENALKIWTDAAFPEEHKATKKLLQEAQDRLQALAK